MATMLDDTMATAKNLMGTAKEGTEHAASSVRSTVLDGVHAITSVASMLRSLGADDALGWVGLSRRRSPLVSMAIFGAGFAAGAGAGLLLAPASGADLRRNLMKSFMGLWSEAKDVAEKVETKVETIEHQAEDLAGKATDAVKKAERKVEGKVVEGAKSLEDSVKTRAAAAVTAVKDTLHDPKSMMSPASDPAHETAETSKGTRGGAGAGHRAG
jgi:gas vesicle protein